MIPDVVLLSLVLILSGLLIAATAYKRVDHLRHLKRNDVRDVPIDGEWQAVRGTIHAQDGVLTAPVTGRPAVALDYKVELRKSRSGGTSSTRKRYWSTVADEEEYTPFVIETEDGLIDVGNNANFRYKSDRKERTRTRHTGLLTGGNEDDSIKRFVERRDNLKAKGKRRYTENTVVDGDDVVVYGHYDENPEGRVIRGSGDFPVVGLNEGHILSTIAKPLLVRGMVALLLVLLGIGVLL